MLLEMERLVEAWIYEPIMSPASKFVEGEAVEKQENRQICGGTWKDEVSC